jgi:IS4 transposase
MILDDVFGAFVEESPVSVMYRATLERVVSPERMDELFAQTAQEQRQGELLFSVCVDLMAQVVAQVHKSVHAAYRARPEPIGVSVKSVYNKLAGVEPVVSESLVRHTAADLAAIRTQLKAPAQELLPGLEVVIVDGNYLAGTDHRLKELRQTGAAALPGMSLCLLDPQRELIRDLIACEDGHANERALTARVLEKVQQDECWIADRNFCTHPLLLGVAARKAFFVVRQHGQVEGQAVGDRKKIGRGEGGTLYEQKLRLTDASGQVLEVRRITIELDEPTRFGETEIHLLTNLPARVRARKIAALYRKRWTIETAFMHLATVLRSEINTLGYPQAALFGFALGVLLYNVLALLQAALRAAHPNKTQGRKLSFYYLGDEITGVYRGMMIAIPPAHWTAAFASLPLQEFANVLRTLAKKADVNRFFTNPTSAKRPPPQRQSGNRGNHVSTFKLLQARAEAKKC